jgi:hypothetical protein
MAGSTGTAESAQTPIQLRTFVALNMATDLMLVHFALPWIFILEKQPLKRYACQALFANIPILYGLRKRIARGDGLNLSRRDGYEG